MAPSRHELMMPIPIASSKVPCTRVKYSGGMMRRIHPLHPCQAQSFNAGTFPRCRLLPTPSLQHTFTNSRLIKLHRKITREFTLKDWKLHLRTQRLLIG